MEQDKEDSMEAIIPLLAGQQNAKNLSSKSANYGSVIHENDDHYFDGLLTGAESLQNGSINSHLASSNSKSTLAGKRTLPSEFWNGTGSIGSSSGKRFHGDLNSGGAGMDENNSSFVSLLNQLPQGTAQFHPNALLGSLGEGVLRQQFQLPMNWNS